MWDDLYRFDIVSITLYLWLCLWQPYGVIELQIDVCHIVSTTWTLKCIQVGECMHLYELAFILPQRNAAASKLPPDELPSTKFIYECMVLLCTRTLYIYIYTYACTTKHTHTSTRAHTHTHTHSIGHLTWLYGVRLNTITTCRYLTAVWHLTVTVWHLTSKRASKQASKQKIQRKNNRITRSTQFIVI